MDRSPVFGHGSGPSGRCLRGAAAEPAEPEAGRRPEADVPPSPSSFIAPRAWSSGAAETGRLASAFADSLDGAAHARRVPTDVLAVRAAAAGTDLILVTGSEAASLSVSTSPLRAARDGGISRARLAASDARILKLKSTG